MNSTVYTNNHIQISNFKEYISSYLVEGKNYDCCLGVSGGKDSTRQALFARDVLGLTPHLVCLSFPPELLTKMGARNLSNLSQLGFSITFKGPAPYDWKRLMRLSLLKYGNPLVPTEQALYSSVPQTAIELGVKLILWGENPALQLGDMNTLGIDQYDGDNLRRTNTLKNTDNTWMNELNPPIENLSPYQYPSHDSYAKSSLKTVFMGPIIQDWSLINNSKYALLNGIDVRRERPENVGDIYGVTALDQHITPLNQVLKYLKYGFGRMTDYVNEEIRLGRLTREAGISLVSKYDGKCSVGYFKRFAAYLDMTYEEFWSYIDPYVNKTLFTCKGVGKYEPQFTIGVGL